MTIEECMKLEEQRMSINKGHLENGVCFQDITTAYIDEGVVIGKGTYIASNVTLSGETKIGENCKIYSGTRIENSHLGNENKIDNAVIVESKIGDGNAIGPFAYLRPNTVIENNCKIGDFVEVKNSKICNGSKASHLTYIGDSDIGENVNLGCGVVFVNYDGKNKYRSVVEDNAFIGCNTNIVSPVTVGDSAYIGAGTTVTKNVPKDSLVVGRTKEKTIENWSAKRGLLKK